ncbi:FtsX-like permease family protein [Microvirga antarctica]|uniref:FtsX-like permease family protein n=1 Tax=Microvirga antarctica TaxID=2819233 RepID=UPI001B306D54|nr:FtsX-like permease family protein [Microvirga antarctica]
MMRLILADLRRLWLGAAVVLVLVALATALGMAVTLQERALRLGSARAADSFDLIVGAPGSETQLVLSTVFLQPSPLPLMKGDVLARLAADPRVAFAAPVGFGDFFGTYPIVGTSSDLATDAGHRPLAEGRLFAQTHEAVAGAGTDLRVGDIIHPMHGRPDQSGSVHKEAAYRVVGRMAPSNTPWDRAILVPIEGVWAVHGLHAGRHQEHEGEEPDSHDGDEPSRQIHQSGGWAADLPGLPAIVVKPKTIADAYRLRAAYRTDSALAVFPGEVLTNLYGTLGDARTVLALVVTGAQALVGAAIALIAIGHVSQRRRQIGALRALGAPRIAIFGIVWGEIFALVAAGITAGLGLAYLAARLISAEISKGNGVTLPVAFEGSDASRVLALVAAAGLLAAIPAALAYRQPATAALRH